MAVSGALLGIAALLVLTLALGLTLRGLQRRTRREAPADAVGPELVGADALGERATILQFSTDFCTRCAAVHDELGDLANAHDGVRHLDVDLTHRPDLARRFQVLQTPTTLILDQDGVITTRFGGIPGRAVVEFELERVLGSADA